MKLKVLSIGKSTPQFIVDGVRQYIDKVNPMVSLDWVELIVKKKSEDPKQTLLWEEELLLKNIQKGDIVYLLDEKGTLYSSSREFSQFIEKLQMQNAKQVVFVIGGAFGFSDALRKIAQGSISLSKLTFSHQLIRLIFLEQIYRAFGIINHLPYHND